MIQPRNPYHDGDRARLSFAPFAGRQAIMTRAAALLAEPGRANGLLVLGAPAMGKSALLAALAASLPDPFVPVTVSLRTLTDALPPGVYLDEARLFPAIAAAVQSALIDRAFTLSRLDQIDPPGDDPRGWLELVFLPPIFGALRLNRPMVWLIDDAHLLIDAIRAGVLPADLFAWLSGMLGRARRIHLILTADDAVERDQARFAPLVGMNDVVRLPPLDSDDLRWLFSAPIEGMFTLSEAGMSAAIALCGGFPAFAQRLGWNLVERWRSAPEITTLGAREVGGAQPGVFLRSEDEIIAAWDRLTVNERLVLGALAGLHYDDPLRRANAEAIQRWLASGDSPLDVTTVSTALRALEYRFWITLASDGAALRSGLHLTWLLNSAPARARLRAPVDAPPSRRPRRFARGAAPDDDDAPPPMPPAWRRLIRLLVIVFVLVLIANLLVLLVSGGLTPDPSGVPATATLFPPP
jgi:hypothetical protein